MPRADTNPLWQFSLEVYGAPGVAGECIDLQDRHGVDVNILLCAAWLGSAGELLSDADLRAMQRKIAGLQQRAILPVRAARRYLKEVTHPGLYDEIKAFELRLEQAEQDDLFALTETFETRRAAPADALRRNVALYMELKAAPMPGRLIAAAAARLPRSDAT